MFGKKIHSLSDLLGDRRHSATLIILRSLIVRHRRVGAAEGTAVAGSLRQSRSLMPAAPRRQCDTRSLQDVQNGRSAKSQRGGHLSAGHAGEIALDDIRAQRRRDAPALGRW